MTFQNVLIVDDSSTSRLIVKKCMEIAGYEDLKFFEAEDGMVAIGMLKKMQIDLILTDLNMPKMDGANFIREIRKEFPNYKGEIVVISSLAEGKLDDDLRAMGIRYIIKKPISPQKIVETIGDRNG